MQRLARREAQIMEVLWRLKRAFVREIIAELPDPKPHYNTVSTMVKILEGKGFVAHEKLGNAYRFYPVVAERDYRERAVDEVVDRFFDKSPMKLVNYFAREQKLDAAELERLVRLIKSQEE
jgi:predicted transcriptional regulator